MVKRTVDRRRAPSVRPWKKPRLADAQLFRVYYYDAVPLEGRTKSPVDGSPLDFSTTPQARLNRQLIDTLEIKPDWKLGARRAALTRQEPKGSNGPGLRARHEIDLHRSMRRGHAGNQSIRLLCVKRRWASSTSWSYPKTRFGVVIWRSSGHEPMNTSR